MTLTEGTQIVALKADPVGIIERAATQERATAFMGALIVAQRGMAPIAKDMRNDTTKSRYASLK